MNKETKGMALVGCAVTVATLCLLFPAWVYVMRSILVRGGATDFEWFVFYGYIAGHVAMNLFASGIRVLTADS